MKIVSLWEMTLLQRTFMYAFGDLVSILVKTFNYPYDEGELSSSQKQAVITLIETWGLKRKI